MRWPWIRITLAALTLIGILVAGVRGDWLALAIGLPAWIVLWGLTTRGEIERRKLEG